MFVQRGVKPVDIVSFFLIKQAAFLVFFLEHTEALLMCADEKSGICRVLAPCQRRQDLKLAHSLHTGPASL